MCGISGIYAYHYAAPPADREELRRIRDHMSARGPDGRGEWASPEGRAALGHTRLAIIDLSERGAQPMASADGRLVVSYNGEIYNYRELRRELEAKGERFVSDSDTEVLLHLYAREGEAMVRKLRGMFAFLLWDERKKALLMARDPYGIKPLYYADDGWSVRAASQVKALLAGGGVSTEREPAGIVGFYLLGSVPEPYTTYSEIRAVPAGHTLWVDDLGPHEPRPYFSIPETLRNAEAEARATRSRDSQAAAAAAREALLDSIRHHLVADVPVGAFLSSGVDSGAVVGLMREAGASDLQTVTLSFEEFEDTPEDEGPLAERTARHYGVRHHRRVVTGAEFRDDLPRILEAMDQPSIDGINTWFVAKAARELGLKTAVSGLGGDELFGAYPSFRDVPRWVRTLALPSRLPLLPRASRWLLSRIAEALDLSPKAAALPELGGSTPGAWLLRRGIFLPWELERLLPPETVERGLRRLRPLELIREAGGSPPPRSPFGRVAALEMGLYLKNQLLRDADWAGMAHSLEIRTPLVDHVLLAALAPWLVQRREGLGTPAAKAWLAQAPTPPLPEEIRRRRKTGFGVPMPQWLGAAGGAWQATARENAFHWSRDHTLALAREAGLAA